jgi:uncharacterized protein YodC (DUF2158 family)
MRIFQPGEIVHLNSGGPEMRVITQVGTSVRVEWDMNPGKTRGNFEEATLHTPPNGSEHCKACVAKRATA